MATPAQGAASRTHDDLQAQPPKDRMARVVQEIVGESRKGITNQALMHYEALMNSLCIHPTESFVTSYTPYGQSPYPFSNYYGNRAVGQVMSPFTAEQVNAITTRLCAPLIGQQEVLYVIPQGNEDILKANVRGRLYERMIRSPYTNWADLCWRTCRDLAVRSRAYQEVRPLKVRRYRRQYQYENPAENEELLAAGIDPQELATLGTIRTSYLGYQEIWNGPVVAPLMWGTVHKDKSETVITDNTLFVIVERQMSWQQFLIEGAAMFPKGGETVSVPFSEETARSACQNPESGGVGPGEIVPGSQFNAEPLTRVPQLYEPIKFYEFRGIDPLGSPENETLAWVSGGQTLGSKIWDGSGSVMNVIEWVWDPINGLASSSSPAMILRTLQEELSLLMNAGENAILWDSTPGGGINMDRVNDANQVRNLRPGQYFALQGEAGQGDPIYPMRLGQNASLVTAFMADMEQRGRLASGAIASIVGDAPQGVNTLGEFAGITQGAIDRITTQVEINADVALRRQYRLGEALWRDRFATDAELQEVLGQNEDTLQATLADLDGDMEVQVMAARYHQVRQATVNAIGALLDRAANDPQLAARIKPSVYDDWAYAIAGPSSRRWYRGEQELVDAGFDPNALQQQAVANASAPKSIGTPSPPKEQPQTGAAQVQQQGATV